MSSRATLDEIPAFTFIQPWGEVVLRQRETIDGRTRNSKVRGYIALHASRTNSAAWFAHASRYHRMKFDRGALPFGCIIGFADLVDVICTAGEYGLVLQRPIRLKNPVPAKGARGSWTLRGAPLQAAMDQLSDAQIKRIYKRQQRLSQGDFRV